MTVTFQARKKQECSRGKVHVAPKEVRLEASNLGEHIVGSDSYSQKFVFKHCVMYVLWRKVSSSFELVIIF